MSLVSIDDVKNIPYGFDIEGTVKSLSKPKYVNKKNGDVALVAKAKLSDGLGNMINVCFWNDDIKKVRNDIRIRINNAYTKNFQGIIEIYKSKNGTIDILDFNPDNIFDDMEKFQRYHKDITSIKQYYDYVKSSKSNIYLGAKKSEYLEIIDALLTIQFARKMKTKRNMAELKSIHHLHQIVKLSPVKIRQILGLFKIHIEIERILRVSSEWEEKQFLLNFPKINFKTLVKDESNSDEQIHLEISYDEIPEELIIEESYQKLDLSKPLCESDRIEYQRKYKGYIDFYSNPWK